MFLAGPGVPEPPGHSRSGRSAKSGGLVLTWLTLHFRCFWPAPGFEYEHLASALRDVLTADTAAFAAARLAVLTEAELQGWFPGHELPNCAERVSVRSSICAQNHLVAA